MTRILKAKYKRNLLVAITILSLSVLLMSLVSYFIDKDGTIVPYTTFMLMFSLIFSTAGIKESK